VLHVRTMSQVLVEVCDYCFERGRNLFVGTDQDLENDGPQTQERRKSEIALFELLTTVDGIVLNNQGHGSKNLFSSYGD